MLLELQATQGRKALASTADNPWNHTLFMSAFRFRDSVRAQTSTRRSPGMSVCPQTSHRIGTYERDDPHDSPRTRFHGFGFPDRRGLSNADDFTVRRRARILQTNPGPPNRGVPIKSPPHPSRSVASVALLTLMLPFLMGQSSTYSVETPILGGGRR
jgi:hypothetical protein